MVMTKPERVFYACLFAVAFYPIVIGASYLWLRSVHTPLNPYQKHLLRYQMIVFAPTPILGGAIEAFGLYVVSIQTSLMAGASLFLLWLFIAKKLNGPRPSKLMAEA